MQNEKEKTKIDSTSEEEIPEDVTKEELEIDQHRDLTPEEKERSKEIIEESGLEKTKNDPPNKNL